MIKVTKKSWDEVKEVYVLTLDDGDAVFVPESKYDQIQLHESVNGKRLKAVVDEHEDNYSEPIEYVGFELMK